MTMKTVDKVDSPIINITKPGTKYTGYFLRCRKGKFGFLYDMIGRDGICYTLKGNTDIVMKFQIIPEGSFVEIEYIGLITSESGNEMKSFKIAYDDEDNFHHKPELTE